jgi:hypothetical protein
VVGTFVLVFLLVPPLLVKFLSRVPSEDSTEGEPEVDPVKLSAIVPAPTKPPPQSPRSNGTNGSKSKATRLITHRVLGWYVDVLAMRPLCAVMGSVVAVIVFVVGVVLAAKLDTEVPDLFPDHHNQVTEAKLQERFAVMDDIEGWQVGVDTGAACKANASWYSKASRTFSDCTLHWCEAPRKVALPATNDSVTCWIPKATNPFCKKFVMRIRLAATTTPSTSAWISGVKSMIASSIIKDNSTLVQYNGGPRSKLPTMILENWETGSMATSRFYDMGEAVATVTGLNLTKNYCQAQALCFQGSRACDLPAWRSVGSFRAPADRRLLEDASLASASTRESESSLAAVPARDSESLLEATAHPLSRRLSQVAKVPVSKRVDVSIVWGVRPAQSTPLVGPPKEIWSFDPTFEPNNPWAQRAMVAMCEDLPANLYVEEKNCWMSSFQYYVRYSLKSRFPTRSFGDDIASWSIASGSLEIPENIWRKNNQVQAAKISFVLNVAKDIGAQSLLKHRERWDSFVAAKNAAASITANQAFHTARAWVRAEAEVAVIDSTINTIVVSAACAWIGMTVFTLDPVLAFMVLVLVLGIIVGLAFFMVVVMGWNIGSIEVISLVIFMGYSVTYSLHVAHNYAEAKVTEYEGDVEAPLADPASGKRSPRELRHRRTKEAIEHIGSAVLSSAMSTFGSSCFLLGCTMVIFVKLGAVVLAVTVLSVLSCLVTLPALLILIGPPQQRWHLRCASCMKSLFGRRRKGE